MVAAASPGPAARSRTRLSTLDARNAGAAAGVTDAEARAVEQARAAGPLRRALAAIARRLVATRAWERLGYARLADYARERAGLSARQVQDLAHVGEALARLPPLEEALVQGALTWTKTRLLARVATLDDAERWVAFARGTTARALAREVRAVDAGALEAGALETDEDGAEVREKAGVVVRCSPRVQSLFHGARWLARIVAGEELPSWASMEAVAAEVLSALPLAASVEEVDAEGGETRADAQANGCATQGRPRELPGTDPGARARAGLAAPPAAPFPAAVPHAAVTHAGAPIFLRALLEDLDAADAFELDARLRRAVALEQRLEAELAPLVRAVAEAGLHRRRGFATLETWARERLGVSPRKVRALLRLARAVERWPALGEAFRGGRLSWVQAHAILQALALGTAGGPSLWIERAASLPVTRLREEVDAALLGAQPGEGQTGAQHRDGAEDAGEVAPPAEPEPEAERFFFIGPVEVTRLFRAVLCSVRRHLERSRGRLPTEGEAAGWMFEHAIASWRASAACDARTRRAHRVFERDGWRCTVPGCTSYRNLHDHHVRFRSAGGSDALANRTTLCAFHHLRGVHAGRVRVSGAAPWRLRFELGLRPGRPPLVAYAPSLTRDRRR